MLIVRTKPYYMQTALPLKMFIVLPMLFAALFMSCTKEEDPEMASKNYSFGFNTGSVGDAYAGTHPKTTAMQVTVEELPGNKTKLLVLVTNTLNGKIYNVHFNTATPGGSSLFEASPKYTIAVTGNGITGAGSTIVSDPYSYITGTWKGYAIIHDPEQTFSVTNFKTFLVIDHFN
jgi:hypothetical protein